VARKFLGISVTPAAVQNEGLQAVMDRIQATGANAISTGAGLSQPAERGQGHREPPLDIDGYERLLDRPLWGQRELYLQGYRTYAHDEALFADTPYRPGGQLAPVELDRDLPHKILAEAHSRGMAAHLQLGPTGVPGLRPEDQVHYPDGSVPGAQRVARQGCLNNPAVRPYILAIVLDAAQQFPEADGLFLDWVEYTVYDLRDHFGCTCPHCARSAQAWGYDWERISRDVRALWDRLHRLDAQDLEYIQRIVRTPSALLELLQTYPGWLDFLRFKGETVTRLYADIRQSMNDAGASRMELGANGWPPPFNRSSGMDYRALAGICQSVRPKLYTFHWSVMPRWYGQLLREWNPSLPESQLLDTLVAALDLPDDVSPRTFARYHIPAPEEAHPALPESWRSKLDEVVDQVGGRTRCYAYAHSYRPAEQWKRMVAVVRDSRVDGMWVTRYGYMTDAKLQILADMWR